MQFACFRPDPDLAPYLEAIWVMEVPADLAQAPMTTLPITSVVACFQYGAPILSDEHGLTRSGLTGLQSTWRRLQSQGALGTVAVRFKPGGAACFFRESLDAFLDHHLPLTDVFGSPCVALLEEQLAEAPDAPSRAALVQRFFREVFRAEAEDRLVQLAARRLNEQNGQLPIAELARCFALSERQLERRFRRAIGIGPKKFARIVRFQRVLSARQAAGAWSAAALDAGYFDQSHLIRDFQAMAGLSPQDFLASETSPLARLFDLGRMSEFSNINFL